MADAAAELGERLLDTPQNPISIAMTVDTLGERLRLRQRAQHAGTQGGCGDARACMPRPVPESTDPVSGGGDNADDATHGGASSLQPAQSNPDAAQRQAADNDGDAHTCSHIYSRRNAVVEGAEGDAALGAAAEEGAKPVAAEAPGVVEGGRGSRVQGDTATVLGALMWQRHVSGVRVVCRGKRQTVAGVAFDGYGSSCGDYGHDYLTAAAALGQTREDVDRFVAKLRKCWALV